MIIAQGRVHVSDSAHVQPSERNTQTTPSLHHIGHIGCSAVRCSSHGALDSADIWVASAFIFRPEVVGIWAHILLTNTAFENGQHYLRRVQIWINAHWKQHSRKPSDFITVIINGYVDLLRRFASHFTSSIFIKKPPVVIQQKCNHVRHRPRGIDKEINGLFQVILDIKNFRTDIEYAGDIEICYQQKRWKRDICGGIGKAELHAKVRLIVRICYVRCF